MESVPKETETIAHKRALRISEKLRYAREKIGFHASWWTSEVVELIGLAVLFLINFILIYPLFGKPSVSVTFSGPVIPLIAKAISLLGSPFIYSVQLVNIIFFAFFPSSFYFFVKFVSGRKFAAFLSTLIASLPVFIFAKTRIEYGLLSNESAYISSLTILPIALVMLLKFLRSGGVTNLAVASFITAFMALISPFGIFIYIIASGITTFSEMLLGEGRIKILRLFTVAIFSASLTSFWYNPGFFVWMIMGPLGTEIRGMISRIIPISFFAVPVLASLGYLLFDRKPNLQPIFLALFYTIVFLIIVITGGGFVPSNPGRYLPVLGTSLAFLIGTSILMAFEYLNNVGLSRSPHLKGFKSIFLVLISLALISFIVTGRGMVIISDEKVLGIWTDVKKGDIWLAKDNFGAGHSAPGYVISFAGAGTLLYLFKKKGFSED